MSPKIPPSAEVIKDDFKSSARAMLIQNANNDEPFLNAVGLVSSSPSLRVNIMAACHPVEILQKAVAYASLTDCYSASIASDSYHAVAETGEPRPPLTGQHSLEERFKNGDTTVSEALIIISVAKGAIGSMEVLPYERERGHIIWLPSAASGPDEMEGRIPDVVERFFDHIDQAEDFVKEVVGLSKTVHPEGGYQLMAMALENCLENIAEISPIIMTGVTPTMPDDPEASELCDKLGQFLSNSEMVEVFDNRRECGHDHSEN